MIHRRLFITLVFAWLTACAYATTWDEPWQEDVIKNADYFVLANVKSATEKKGITIEIIKTLGGPELKGSLSITDYYLLSFGSYSGRYDEFDFPQDIKKCYFFIKKNAEGHYCMATPTAGYAKIKAGKVYATYRHSYHQALVPVDDYELTMTAIFNNYHKLPYNKQAITDYIDKYIKLKPSGFAKDEVETFFAQHVALECIYHLRLTGYYDQLLPFFHDRSNFHNQVSAARALISYNTPICKQELMKVIIDTTNDIFVQVICIWSLSEFKPTELKEQLIQIKETASTKENGFGGDIMDPRVGTMFPTVREALIKLIDSL